MNPMGMMRPMNAMRLDGPVAPQGVWEARGNMMKSRLGARPNRNNV
jgi:hypothetical protein